VPSAAIHRRPRDTPWRRKYKITIQLDGRELDFLTEMAQEHGLAVGACARRLMLVTILHERLRTGKPIWDY
jgi:sulfur transfer protein SufE